MVYKYLRPFLMLLFLGGLVIAAVSFIRGDSLSPLSQPKKEEDKLMFDPALSPAPPPASPTSSPQSINPLPTSRIVRQYRQFPGELIPSRLQHKKAVMETDKGKIVFEIYPEATKAASNFIFLVGEGFYDGLTFHRVEPGFVVQGGDPLGNGTGGPGYSFEDEPVIRPYTKGTVAMANSGPNTNGSQFFILLSDFPLPPRYTIFGRVTEGYEIVEKIQVGWVMRKVKIEESK